MKSKNVVWRLLRRNISAAQLAGYALANLVGLAIVLTAIQFYRDITAAWDADDSFFSTDYLIISRKVSTAGSLLGAAADGFSAADIADIEQQPWAKSVGCFTSSAFNVAASIDMGGRNMSTALFLESIPSDFFDVVPRGWSFTPGQSEPVPIIISKDYLTLYNFGFAASRGLPQVSEGMTGMIPLRLSLSGAGRQQWIAARIAGFSSRLNTIAVPEEFMQWANATFADEQPGNPQRLIIRTNTPGDPAIAGYLDSHGYESAGDKVDNGKAAYFLSVATAVVIAVGAVISLLAFFILLLSIYLLLQKNRDKIHDLMMLGYTPADVGRHYRIIVVAVNAVVLITACAIVATASHLWGTHLSAIDIEHSSLLPTILIGAAITLAVTAANLTAINRKVRAAFR